MAQPIWRTTIFFTQGQDGWSETYYQLSRSSDYQAAHKLSRGLVKKRWPMLAPRAKLVYVRTSDDNVPGDSFIESYRDSDLFNPDLGNTAPAHVALQLRLNAGPLCRRMVYIRGVPETIVGALGDIIPMPKFDSALKAYAAFVCDRQFAVKSYDKTMPKLNISSWQPNQGSVFMVDLVLVAGFGGKVGDAVTISGWPRKTGWNGPATITNALSPTAYTIQRRTPYRTAFASFPAFLQPRLTTLFEITSTDARAMTHRIQGRPFGLHRGHARARVVA